MRTVVFLLTDLQKTLFEKRGCIWVLEMDKVRVKGKAITVKIFGIATKPRLAA